VGKEKRTGADSMNVRFENATSAKLAKIWLEHASALHSKEREKKKPAYE
jgi:hypothetical protein